MFRVKNLIVIVLIISFAFTFFVITGEKPISENKTNTSSNSTQVEPQLIVAKRILQIQIDGGESHGRDN